MHRRSFLSRSAIGTGVLALGGSGVATTMGCGAAMGPRLAPDEARALIERLENGLATIRSVPRGDIARHMTSHPRPQLAEDVLRVTIEGLFVADALRSVPPGAALAPDLHAQLASAAPLLERSTRTHYALLDRMPHSAKRRVDAHLRKSPGAAMDVAEWIDRHAARLDVSMGSRLALREKASATGARMRRQSTGAVIDDALSKMDGVATRSGSAIASARSARTSAMIDAIWQQLDNAMFVGGPSSRLGAPTAAPVVPDLQEDAEWAAFIAPPSPRQWSARWGRPGDEEVHIAAIMMPFGLASCGLMLIIGLIVLIAGCVQNDEWDGAPRNAQ